MINWVIPGELARSSRPGYHLGRGQMVPLSEVRNWTEDVRAGGIQSVICLLADEHLHLYSSVPGGLLQWYRESSLIVTHIPVDDYREPPLTDSQLEQVLDAFSRNPKPVLIHCSAGIDRTGAAVSFIVERWRQRDSEQR